MTADPQAREGQTFSERVGSHLNESAETKRRFLEAGGATVVEEAARICAQSLLAGGKLLFCGNGGSAADSQHLAAELVVRLSAACEREAMHAVALTTDTSVLTACANDYGYDRIFARQVEGVGRQGDVLLGISTSGGSANVVAAFEVARDRGMSTILFSAGDGGLLHALSQVAILVPAKLTSHIQETHIAVGHIMCEFIEQLVLEGQG